MSSKDEGRGRERGGKQMIVFFVSSHLAQNWVRPVKERFLTEWSNCQYAEKQTKTIRGQELENGPL